MSDRKCPNCGEIVPSLSVTCPKCYNPVPREDVTEKRSSASMKSEEYDKNMFIATILAVIPGIFGLQGLGLIYLNHRESKGWYFLIIGAVLFMCMYLCVNWWNSVGSFTKILLTFSIIIIAITYMSSYLAQLIETRFGSFLNFFRR